MVEVFKTNITDRCVAAVVVAQLQIQLPGAKINFDLEDCDNILKVEHYAVTAQRIEDALQRNGFYCEVLD